MSRDCAVRRATEADLDEITALWAHYIRVHRANPAYRNLPSGALERRRELFARHVTGPDSAVFVLDNPDGGLDGFVTCFIEESPDYLSPPRYGRLQTPYVRPEARGRGYLRRLLDAAYRWARELELTEVRLFMLPGDDGADRLADELGFEAIAVVRRRAIEWDYPPAGPGEALP